MVDRQELEALAPCPFCGSPGEIRKNGFPPNNPFRHPSCSNWECIAYVQEQDEQGGSHVDVLTDKEAADKWNIRTASPAADREEVALALAQKFPTTFTPYGNEKGPNAFAFNVADFFLSLRATTPGAVAEPLGYVDEDGVVYVTDDRLVRKIKELPPVPAGKPLLAIYSHPAPSDGATVKLESDLAYAKEALQFYAQPKNWIDTPSWDGDPSCMTPKAIPVKQEEGRFCDCGDTAREALAAISSGAIRSDGAIRELLIAVRDELHEHNGDYHHHTRPDVMAKLDDAIDALQSPATEKKEG